MKFIGKLKAKFKMTKLVKLVKRVWCPRYWYAHYYKGETVKEKTVLYQAFQSNIMCGNPFAIFTELMKRPEYKDYTHIWVYRSEKSLNDDTYERFSVFFNVRYVKIGTREYCKYLASCKYLIANSTLPPYWIKKKEQIYINTWHGVPLKTLGRDESAANALAVKNCQRNFYMCNYLVMPNMYTTEHIVYAYGLSGLIAGKIINTGYPRTDLVIKTSKEYIRGLLELKLKQSLANKKIVLYAPTFRSDGTKYKDMTAEIGKHMTRMIEIIPENYVLIFKAHNRMGSFFRKNKEMHSRLIFDEIETNELLSVTDVLITDYSSIFFDFLCTQKPILFFCYDKDEYSDGRGLYLQLNELPGAVCETVDEIAENFLKIENGSYDYSENYNNFLNKFSYNDDGKASQRVVDIVFGQKPVMDQYIYQPQDMGERILVIGGISNSLENRGECIRVLKELDSKKNTVALMAPYVYSFGEDFDETLKNIRLISFEPDFLFTFNEKVCQKFFHRMPKEEEFYDRQYRQYFGKITFSKVIDLNGADSPWRKVFENKCDKYEPRFTKEIANEKVARREAIGHKMTVLFLATFDSVNYLYVNLIRELEKRCHLALLVVKNGDDTINNRMFLKNGISFVGANDFDISELEKVDFVICSPFKAVEFNKIMSEINRRKIFCIGFTNLFSSILMKPYTDIVFTAGTSKFEEFEENGLHYSMVAVGNPQYDGLIKGFSKPRITDQQQIKRILFIDQGGYPFGAEGKKLLGDVILAMARQHHDKRFVVKPRYLPDDVESTVILHRPTEHLYDFIQNPPDNLILLREATVLEDIITDFDAVVTMWSTAYLDAAMCNMPIMLISMLPSEEVIDVRVQRIKEAYEYLDKTGCVVDYKDVLEGKLEFRYIDSEYLRNEIESPAAPSAPRVVDILEDIYKYWIVFGLCPYEPFQMTGTDFREKLPNMATVKTQSSAYQQRRSFLTWFNNRMQDLAFLNRSMAKPFDFSPLQKYWYFFPQKKFHRYRIKLLKLKVRLTTEMIKRKYFNSAEINSETDGIRLDYYYDRLFRHKKYKQIKKFGNPNVLPETKAFYLSMVYLREKNYNEAAKEFAKYYHITENLKVKPIAKDRHINYNFISNGAEIESFFKALFAMGEYDILKALGTSKRFNISLRKRYLKKVMRTELLNLPKNISKQ